jgi:hypothetical protein
MSVQDKSKYTSQLHQPVPPRLVVAQTRFRVAAQEAASLLYALLREKRVRHDEDT